MRAEATHIVEPCLIAHYRAECVELDGFVASLSEMEWGKRTSFWGWTTFDEILHLYYVDRFALASVTDAVKFAEMRDAYRKALGEGAQMSELTRREFGHRSKSEALDIWRTQYIELCTQLSARPLTDRIAWFGPDMSIGSMATARQMEVWAHGQDIYDRFRTQRREAARLHNICELGVRTFGWTFANRQLARPGPTPTVRLSAPDGGSWVWNEGADGLVSGPARDFALIVTQRRNVADTQILCEGAAATAWMASAQCFAGPPAEPPAAGERAW